MDDKLLDEMLTLIHDLFEQQHNINKQIKARFEELEDRVKELEGLNSRLAAVESSYVKRGPIGLMPFL